MSSNMTPDDFLGKIDWEGGIDAALDYGLSASDLDDSDPDLKEAWETLERLRDEGSHARSVIDAKMYAYFEGGDSDDEE